MLWNSQMLEKEWKTDCLIILSTEKRTKIKSSYLNILKQINKISKKNNKIMFEQKMINKFKNMNKK